jgi:hypothetical protein
MPLVCKRLADRMEVCSVTWTLDDPAGRDAHTAAALLIRKGSGFWR